MLWMSSSEFGLVDEGAQGAGAAQFDAVTRAQQLLVSPDAVEVLVHATRRKGVGRVEASIGLHIGKGQGHAARHGPPGLAQQPVHSDGAADLVAMRQSLHQHARAGLARIEAVHPIDARCCPVARGRCRAR
jgi:hypothetical protein